MNPDGVSAPSNEGIVVVAGACSIPAAPANLRLMSVSGNTLHDSLLAAGGLVRARLTPELYIPTNAVIEKPIGYIQRPIQAQMSSMGLQEVEKADERCNRLSCRAIHAREWSVKREDKGTIRAASSTYSTWLAPTSVISPRLTKVSLTFHF